MCVATLHASTQPCAHRWYRLARPCDPANDLQNCSKKLKLEGWECRTDECPWCDLSNEDNLHESSYRLLGGFAGFSTPSSPTISDLGSSTPNRVDSINTIGSQSSLSRQSSSTSSADGARGQQHREMEERLHLYLNSHPHHVLPSAAKNYPTYPQWQSVQSPEPSLVDESIMRRHSKVLSAQWRRKFRSSISLVKRITMTEVNGLPM